MRYEFYGAKLPFAGKTLWEILGNLKNFGVGRYIERYKQDHIKGPCFLKILDVQVLPPSRRKFIDRKVIVFMDEWHNGLKVSDCKEYRATNVPKFQLIPKHKEHIFLEAAEEFSKNFVKREIPKYAVWPPLFKLLWERQQYEWTGEYKEIPKLELIFTGNTFLKTVVREDLTQRADEVNFNLSDSPVEDKIQEVVALKKKVNFLKNSNK